MTSILDTVDMVDMVDTIATAAPTTELSAPYRCGDRICASSPEGTRYLARVEAIKRNPSGDFTVLAAVTEPRRYRSHLLTALVGADGYGPAVQPLS